MSIDRSSESADAHGQAAMLLIESLIHTLIEKDLITVADAMEIIGTAIEVKFDGAGEEGDSAATTIRSLELLDAIGNSLSRDVLLD
jgi:hypothetical protein